MNANGSNFHLVLTQQDWQGWACDGMALADVWQASPPPMKSSATISRRTGYVADMKNQGAAKVASTEAKVPGTGSLPNRHNEAKPKAMRSMLIMETPYGFW